MSHHKCQPPQRTWQEGRVLKSRVPKSRVPQRAGSVNAAYVKENKRTVLMMIAWGCVGWALLQAFFAPNSSSDLNTNAAGESKAGGCLTGKWLVIFDEISGLWSHFTRPLWCPMSKYEVIDFRPLNKPQHHRDQANMLQILPTMILQRALSEVLRVFGGVITLT